jgi:hypothetical protein
VELEALEQEVAEEKEIAEEREKNLDRKGEKVHKVKVEREDQDPNQVVEVQEEKVAVIDHYYLQKYSLTECRSYNHIVYPEKSSSLQSSSYS